MPKNKIDPKKVITLGDIITIIIILIGLMIAVFAVEPALKLIGISLAILGVVRLVMFITHRINVMIDTNKLRPKVPPQEYKVTEKQDKKAKRVVIEDFGSASQPKTDMKKKEEFTREIRDEEGFRLIKDNPQDQAGIGQQLLGNESLPRDSQESGEIAGDNFYENTFPENNIFIPSFDEGQMNFEFDEEFSGIKVIAKTNTQSEKINIQMEGGLKDTGPLQFQSGAESGKTATGQQNDDIELKDDDSKNSAGDVVSPDKTAFEQGNADLNPVNNGNIADKYKEKNIEIPLSDLMETDPAFGLEPRKEFEYFLNRVLKIIRSVTSTKSAVFLLVNSERRELVVEAYDSDTSGKIAARRRIPFGNDIVSQIVGHQKPEILTEINPHAELDLIPYYVQSVGSSSFFGMPVFYNEAIVGVLCVDSDDSNAYDTSVVALFGHFAKLIGSLVKSYTGKYDLLQDSRTLKAINLFRSMLDDNTLTLPKIYEAVLSSASGIFENAVTGIIGIDRERNAWIVTNVMNNNYPGIIEEGTIVSPNSLCGSTINFNKLIINVPNLSGQVRINENEEKLDSGYFISVPLKSFTNNYGALFVEGLNPADISAYDITMLETLASHSGSTIEQIHFSEVLTRSALFDPSTGLLNTPAFHQRLNEEVMRSLDFGYPLTLCLLQIDKYKSFDPENYNERTERVLIHVVDIMQSKLRPYDLLGRAESNIFGIVLIDVNVRDAKIWAEKLRSDIAINVLKIGQDSFTVTVSLGVSKLSKDESVDDIIANAKEMLLLSRQKTNTVTVFE